MEMGLIMDHACVKKPTLESLNYGMQRAPDWQKHEATSLLPDLPYASLHLQVHLYPSIYICNK
jgi:hypothetical protein